LRAASMGIPTCCRKMWNLMSPVHVPASAVSGSYVDFVYIDDAVDAIMSAMQLDRY
jgi:nucleoside-diphosphate-sugar epimerase